MTGIDTLENVMGSVIKTINYVYGRSKKHHEFAELLKEMESCDLYDIIFFAGVCWLIHGRVLNDLLTC
jgi:hypothetical protein